MRSFLSDGCLLSALRALACLWHARSSLDILVNLPLSLTAIAHSQVRSFVSRLLGMGDVGGLMNAIKDAGLDKQPELYQKLSQGVFTLRDMYEQFQVCSHPPLPVLSQRTHTCPPSRLLFPLPPSQPRRLNNTDAGDVDFHANSEALFKKCSKCRSFLES